MTWKAACAILALFTLLTVFFVRGSSQGTQPAFWEAEELVQVRDEAYAAIDPAERVALAYDPIREADVFWSKRVWRDIDFREKMNLPFAYPKEPVVGILMDAVLAGELTAYHILAEDFSEPLAPDALESRLAEVDTVPWFALETGDYLYDTVIRSEPDWLAFRKLRIMEEWIFDEETSTLVCRIIGLAPVRMRVDEWSGLTIGEEPVCWIHYPSARNLLATHQAFNPYNDAFTLSWEDILEMRYFSSTVVRESNVHDRYVASYASGEEAVLESDRIKMGIFRFEHELWEY